MPWRERDPITGKEFTIPQIRTGYGASPEVQKAVQATNEKLIQETIQKIASYQALPSTQMAYKMAGIDVKTGQPITQQKAIDQKQDGNDIISNVADIIKSYWLILLVVAVVVILIWKVAK